MGDQLCPKCKKGYLELDLDEETCYCDTCGAEFEATIISEDE